VLDLGAPQRTPAVVKAALLESEDRLIDAVDRAATQIPDGARLLDQLERTIEDVTDPQLYTAFRRLLEQLDEERGEIRNRCRDVNVHLGLDPIRIALRELEAGFS
jgi:hypothetical protein